MNLSESSGNLILFAPNVGAVTESDIGVFDHWSASPTGDASFTNANNPTTGVNFHQEGVTVTANYVSANAEEREVAIGEGDTLYIPAGGIYNIEPTLQFGGFRFNVAGTLMAEGSEENPIIFQLTNPDSGLWGGFILSHPNADITLKYIHISDAAYSYGSGAAIVLIEGKATIEDCIITRPALQKNAISISDGVEAAILRNLLVGDGDANSTGISCTSNLTDNVLKILNNTIVNFGIGISASSNTSCTEGNPAIDMRNNIIYYDHQTSGGTYGFDLNFQQNYCFDVTYNDIYGYTEQFSIFLNYPYKVGVINDDPIFVDSDNVDYHLTTNSPCIDAGDPDLNGDGMNWETDPDDQDPDGTRMDMGALYYDGIPSIPSGFGITGSAGQHPTLYWNLYLSWKSDIVWYKIYRRLTDYQSTYEYLTSVDKYTNLYEDTQVTIASSGGKLRLNPSACYRITAEDSEGSESDMTFPKCKPYLPYKQIVKSENLPDKFALYENHPNPFNPITTIKYDLPEESFVELTIFDLLGREVKTLINGSETAGFKRVLWDGKNNRGKSVASGLYIYRLTAESIESNKKFHQTRKMVLLR
ncbi:MAG: T9SS type A sorting domain-containing protein [Candidatus Marinimicrobia bacterium]|nr:T9SS type A sorting domain-containing protein [Candidatus Neomarinimicrobiota bacterium]